MPTLANVSIKDNSSWTTLLNMIYPVGSYYISNSSTSPADKFGGSWATLTGRFLYCNSGTSTGGTNDQALTDKNIPRHTHLLRIGWGDNNSLWNTLYAATGLGSSWGAPSTCLPEIQDGYSGERFVPEYAPTHNNMPAYKTCYCWYRTA